MGKQRRDLTCMRFGKLIALECCGKNKHGKYVWKCLCDCGNIVYVIASRLITGRTQSCGCLQKEKTSLARKTNLTGQRFGRLLVVCECGRRNGRVLWECLCDCGNIAYATTSDLINGKTKSCGCYKKEKIIERCVFDLVGQMFGRLTVKRSAYSSGRGMVWECVCSCGNTIFVTTSDLINGHTQSCGCIQSKSEELISRFLLKNNIQYQKQKCFIGCKNKALLRFDFFLTDFGIAIEYDGEFHYKETSIGNDLILQKHNDQIKTKYCEENNIILLRIPYWEKDNIESILSEWLNIDCVEEANSSNAGLSA